MNQVKIIGLSVTKNFGGLKATELSFDDKNRLTVVKGEVGSGKTTLNRAMRLTTQGSSTLTDKNLYGEVDLTTHLVDGDTSIYVGCRTNKDKSLDYFLYSIDKDGNKIKDVVVDGQRLTPANYLKSLQTALTWRIDELTSENPVTQRNILLELYQKELEKEGVIFDKRHPDYTKSIIHKIEEARNHRNLMDMKRKEVGGIADDLNAKGIDFEVRREERDITVIENKISSIKAKIAVAKENSEQTKENTLNKLKLKANEIVSSIKDINVKIKNDNKSIDEQKEKVNQINDLVNDVLTDLNASKLVMDSLKRNLPDLGSKQNEVVFNESGKIESKAKDFENKELHDLLNDLKSVKKKYKKAKSKDAKTDTSEYKEELVKLESKLSVDNEFNKEAIAVNAFQDWKEANAEVKSIKNKYYLKLTSIKTGVKGLHICVDEETNDNIYLAYDGSYDPKYFNNKDKEMRKLSSYSGTQKPMICLLIQDYFLRKKPKALPYLWIDDVPIDTKTRGLLEKMAKELDLWLFVNWTGDFKAKNLKNGEILLENGELLMRD